MKDIFSSSLSREMEFNGLDWLIELEAIAIAFEGHVVKSAGGTSLCILI